jgi:nitrogen regulatory protein PII-like uncharacterized protein
MEMKLTLRPSAASRWLNCPGSVKLSMKVPYEQSGEAAQIGTAIHALAETCYQVGVDPMDYVGEIVEGIKLTEENCEFAVAHLSEIKRIESDLGSVMVEQYVVAYEDKYVKLGGTADVVAYSTDKSKLIIADLKTGRGFVEEDSEQMKIYAIGAMNKAGKDFAEIELRIVQPRHGETRIHKMTLAELTDWQSKKLIPSIMATTKEIPVYNKSVKACQWCSAKPICPAHIAELEETEVIADFDVLSPLVLSSLLDKADEVEDYIKALRTYSEKAIQSGKKITGWEMVPKKANRKWSDETVAINALMDLGIEKSKLITFTMVTPAVAEKLLKKEDREIVEGLVERKSSGLTLSRVAEESLINVV